MIMEIGLTPAIRRCLVVPCSCIPRFFKSKDTLRRRCCRNLLGMMMECNSNLQATTMTSGTHTSEGEGSPLLSVLRVLSHVLAVAFAIMKWDTTVAVCCIYYSSRPYVGCTGVFLLNTAEVPTNTLRK